MRPGSTATRLGRRVAAFLRTEAGPTATEYAVLLALVVGACLGALKALGPAAGSAFSSSSSSVGTYGTP